jgi:hypothetical protein
MPISITCPQCRKQHSAPDSLAGRAARCKCGAVIQIPAVVSAMQPGGSSLFDEVSQADIDRAQNRQAAVETSAKVNPYQSSAAAQHLGRAAGSEARRGDGWPAWVKWAVVVATVCSLIVMVVGMAGLIDIAKDTALTQDVRTARSAQLGVGLGMLTAIFWAPSVIYFGRRLTSKQG